MEHTEAAVTTTVTSSHKTGSNDTVYEFLIHHMNKVSDLKFRLRQETAKLWP
jgi:hypothetical protein